MTTNERLDEIQFRLSNIEARFNNMDTRFNNFDSYLNNIENRLINPQLNNPDIITQLGQQLDGIKGELERAAVRDIKTAWYAFMIAGAGFFGAGAGAGAAQVHNLPFLVGLVFAGLIMIIIGYCGIHFRWLVRRRE
jgi:hypothetical protein